MDSIDWSRTALMLLDLQNDFLHPKGAYGRAGLGNPDVAAVVPRLRPLVEKVRARGAENFGLVCGVSLELGGWSLELFQSVPLTAL